MAHDPPKIPRRPYDYQQTSPTTSSLSERLRDGKHGSVTLCTWHRFQQQRLCRECSPSCFFRKRLPYFPIAILQAGKFPQSVRFMTGIQWLKLNETDLTEIPEEMGKLSKLVKPTFLLLRDFTTDSSNLNPTGTSFLGQQQSGTLVRRIDATLFSSNVERQTQQRQIQRYSGRVVSSRGTHHLGLELQQFEASAGRFGESSIFAQSQFELQPVSIARRVSVRCARVVVTAVFSQHRDDSKHLVRSFDRFALSGSWR